MWRKLILAATLAGSTVVPTALGGGTASAASSFPCGYQLGAPSFQGAAGSEYLNVIAAPAVPGTTTT